MVQQAVLSRLPTLILFLCRNWQGNIKIFGRDLTKVFVLAES